MCMYKSAILAFVSLTMAVSLSHSLPRVTKAEIVYNGFQRKLRQASKLDLQIDVTSTLYKPQYYRIAYESKSKHLVEISGTSGGQPTCTYLRIGDNLHIIDHRLHTVRRISGLREPADLLNMMRGYPQASELSSVSIKGKYSFEDFLKKACVVHTYTVDEHYVESPCKTTYHVALDKATGRPIGWTAEVVVGSRQVNKVTALYSSTTKASVIELPKDLSSYRDQNTPASLTSLKVGATFPDCLLSNVKSGLISLYNTARNNKACLFVIWYPGKHEYGYQNLSVRFPEASRIRNKLKGDGFEIVAICLSIDRNTVLKCLPKTKIGFPMAYLKQPLRSFGLECDSIVVLVDQHRVIKWIGNDFYWEEIKPRLKTIGLSY